MLGAFHMLSPSVLLTLLLPQFYRYGNIWLKIRFAQDHKAVEAEFKLRSS